MVGAQGSIQTRDDADAVDADRERGPLRRCIVSRDVFPKDALIRFVVAPDDTLVPDLAGRLPGRGLWVRADRAALQRAVSRGIFAKVARARVLVAGDLVDRVADQLRQRCVDQLGLARRAGSAVAGLEKVRSALAAGGVGLVLRASDAAAAASDRVRVQQQGLSVVTALSAADIGGAFGRDNAVHAAVAAGPLAQKLAADAARLAGVSGLPQPRPINTMPATSRGDDTPSVNGPAADRTTGR